MMDGETRRKLLSHGYRIFKLTRWSSGGYVISELYNGANGWRLFKQFPTKTAAEQVWKELMQDPKCLGD